jgi:hypothetical protein
MSLATFKKKSLNSKSSATKISGNAHHPGYWMTRGPFGRPTSISSIMLADNLGQMGTSGFSLQGGVRCSSVGRDMKMSSNGTRFRGIHPCGNGGFSGQYTQTEPLMNVTFVGAEINGNQSKFIKPSTLGTRGALRQRFKWVYSGQYPNFWVQPNYTGSQVDTSSEGMYIQKKSTANMHQEDVNNEEKYRDYYKRRGPMNCRMTPARGYKMVSMQKNAPYTKTLYRPMDSSTYTLYSQQQCQNPSQIQKPFPYAVQTGTGILTGGIGAPRTGNACNTSNIVLRA